QYNIQTPFEGKGIEMSKKVWGWKCGGQDGRHGCYHKDWEGLCGAQSIGHKTKKEAEDSWSERQCEHLEFGCVKRICQFDVIEKHALEISSKDSNPVSSKMSYTENGKLVVVLDTGSEVPIDVNVKKETV